MNDRTSQRVAVDPALADVLFDLCTDEAKKQETINWAHVSRRGTPSINGNYAANRSMTAWTALGLLSLPIVGLCWCGIDMMRGCRRRRLEE